LSVKNMLLVLAHSHWTDQRDWKETQSTVAGVRVS